MNNLKLCLSSITLIFLFGQTNSADHTQVLLNLSKWTGSYSTQGKSHKANEDRFILEQEQVQGGVLAVVLDGHGGEKVSDFLKNNFVTYLTNELRANQEQSFGETIKSVASQLDTKIGKELKWNDIGSTLSGAYIKGKRAYFFNVGDSRTIMTGLYGSVPCFTQDHKPGIYAEGKRIVDAGGVVTEPEHSRGVYRVGAVAVSRAFGDYGWDLIASKENLEKLRQGGVSPREDVNYAKKFIISTPDCLEMDIGDNNQFLVSASDGLWDVMSNTEVGSLLYLQDNKHKTPAELAKLLADEAIKRGSTDHITVLVLKPGNMNDATQEKVESASHINSDRRYWFIGVPLGIILFSVGFYLLYLRLHK